MLKNIPVQAFFTRCQRFSWGPPGSLMMEMSDICAFPERWACLPHCQSRMPGYCFHSAKPVTRGLMDRRPSHCWMEQTKVSTAPSLSLGKRRARRSRLIADVGLPRLARESGYKNRGPCHIRLVFWILSPALLCTVFQQANAAYFNQQEGNK